MFDFLIFVVAFVVIYLIWREAGNEDLFLRRNLITVLVFCVVAVNVARLVEIRVLYPVLPLVIPLAFWPVLGERRPSPSVEASREELE